MITEDYVSFETAKLLKEKGFDEPLWFYYDSNEELRLASWSGWEEDWNNCLINNESTSFISAPTLQMAMKWLREKYHIYIEINKNPDSSGWRYSIINQAIIDGDEENGFTASQIPKNISYEQACEDAIKACINFLI